MKEEDSLFTKPEIIEGNISIAKFMGNPVKLFKEDEPTYIEYGEQQYASFDSELAIINGIPYSITDLKYHSSFDWIMPVVEKIESLPGDISVRIEGYICDMVETKRDMEITPEEVIKNPERFFKRNVIVSIKYNVKLNLIWMSVVEFIKWYNENNKQS